MVNNHYVGTELPMFLETKNFHRYYRRLFGKFVKGHVLEVGAGLGALTEQLLTCETERITVCEPDDRLAADLVDRLGNQVHVIVGGIGDVPRSLGAFDTILYVDVMEHIEDDESEIAEAVLRLKDDGMLIIGGPAHDWLYASFDAAIGHYRRYNRRMIEKLIGTHVTLELKRFMYFDCVGLILSLGNRWLTRQSAPSFRQLKFWNDFALPLSQRIDSLVNYRIGKSFVAISSLTHNEFGKEI